MLYYLKAYTCIQIYITVYVIIINIKEGGYLSLERISYVQKSTKDMAYNSLKEAVILGKLKPEEQLSEEKLASQLGISRTPLREAIQILINDGWFVKDKTRIKVAPITETEITNLFLIRERLEALAVYQATLKSTPEFERELKKILEKMTRAETSQNIEEIVYIGKEFHFAIIKQSGNKILEDMLSHLLDQIRRYRHLGVWTVPGRSGNAVGEHELIVNAIESRDENKAEKLMKNHISASRKSIILSDNY